MVKRARVLRIAKRIVIVLFKVNDRTLLLLGIKLTVVIFPQPRRSDFNELPKLENQRVYNSEGTYYVYRIIVIHIYASIFSNFFFIHCTDALG